MDETKNRKIYYTMGEVAEMFDVNHSLIRFWEQKFDILKPHKNKKGNRLFTPQDVENLKLIYHLVKERGMTLAGAQKRIKENREGISRDMEIVDRLLGIKAILMEIKQELKEGKGIDSDDDYFDYTPTPIPQATAAENDNREEAAAQTAGADDNRASTPQTADGGAAAGDMGPQPRIIEQTLF